MAALADLAAVAALRRGPLTVAILVPVLPYHRAVCDRAVPRAVDGASIPVVTAEDLIVLKMLWRRAKDVPDVHALIAGAPGLDAGYVQRTLGAILPADDPRHAELQAWLARFGRHDPVR